MLPTTLLYSLVQLAVTTRNLRCHSWLKHLLELESHCVSSLLLSLRDLELEGEHLHLDLFGLWPLVTLFDIYISDWPLPRVKALKLWVVQGRQPGVFLGPLPGVKALSSARLRGVDSA